MNDLKSLDAKVKEDKRKAERKERLALSLKENIKRRRMILKTRIQNSVPAKEE